MGVPGSKVVHYDMGNLHEDYPLKLTLVVMEPCQIRHTALEAARVAANRYLVKQMAGPITTSSSGHTPSCHSREQAGHRRGSRPSLQRNEDGLARQWEQQPELKRQKLFTLECLFNTSTMPRRH